MSYVIQATLNEGATWLNCKEIENVSDKALTIYQLEQALKTNLDLYYRDYCIRCMKQKVRPLPKKWFRVCVKG